MSAAWGAERLARRHDRPFFLAVGFYRPHIPLTAPQRFFDLYPGDRLVLPQVKDDDLDDVPAIARQIAIANWQEPLGGSHFQIAGRERWADVVRAYLACVGYVDDCTGRLFDALSGGPNRDNTLVVVLSDNGWSLGPKLHWQKWGLWEEETHCLLAIRPAGSGIAARRCDEPVDFVDVYPTMLDLCGLPARAEHEGASLRRIIEDARARKDRPALTTFGPGNHSLRTRQWRYTRYSDGSEELYNHRRDRLELINLASSPPAAKEKPGLRRWFPPRDAPPASTRVNQPIEEYTRPVTLSSESTPGPGIAGHAITVSATFEPASLEGSAILYHHGNVNAGFALYLKDGNLAMAIRDLPRPLRWNNMKPMDTVVTAATPLPPGRVTVQGKLHLDGRVELTAGGSVVGTGRAAGPLSVDPTGPIVVGQALSAGGPFPELTVPYGAYGPSDAFRGVLESVTVRYAK